jgi:CBS domain-containing protein
MIEEDLRGVKAADLMTRNVDSVTPDMTLEELSEEFLRSKHTGFPVTADGQLVGCVTMHDLRRFGRDKWATMRVREAMTPKDKLVTARQDDPAMGVLSSMQRGSIGRIFVMDGDKVSGIITRSDVVKALELREGTLGISRGKAAIEGKASMTAETGMRFVLEQPVEEGFIWRAEFSGNEVQLIGQDTIKSPTGGNVQQFTFQANKAGTCVIRLQEVTGSPGKGGSGSKRVLRTVTYTVTVSPPTQVSI